MILALACTMLAQDPDLAAVRASEARRVEVIARCAPAVCSVMDMRAPGGGSGVIFDPAGFVLTNYHVVGEPERAQDDPPMPRPEQPSPAPSPAPAEDDDAETDTETKPAHDGVLPAVPEPSSREVDDWAAAHPGATATERAQFVADWQRSWRAEHLPSGKRHWRNKKVGLADGLLYEAVVLGVDPGSDLAVLRLLPKRAGQRWPACPLGDSDQLLVGETVFAMGNPFLLATDFTPTVTFGIVSGTHRYQEGGGNRMLVYPDCIQVDAPVNPGNSGGPLFNERGEVVGINGRISIGDRGRVNVGVGFAIASNQIRNFLGDLLAGRHAEHGTLDLSAWFMNAPHEQLRRRGVFVQQMYKDSVAAAAGVSLGDEITAFNGTAVRSANQLATLVGVLPGGAWATLGFRPQLGESGYGDERVVDVRLAVLDTGSSADTKADSERLASRQNRRLAAAALRQRWQSAELPAGHGVVLALIAPDGEAQRFVRQGDRLRVDRGEVVLVRDGDQGFAVAAGAVRELTAEERAWLDRHHRANPLLWTPGERAQQLEGALLAGGSHVLSSPAWRFQFDGEGELEAMVFDDGTAAGCTLRDPLRRQRVELHVRGAVARVVVDGVLESGWRVEPLRIEAVAAAVFGRPQ